MQYRLPQDRWFVVTPNIVMLFMFEICFYIQWDHCVVNTIYLFPICFYHLCEAEKIFDYISPILSIKISRKIHNPKVEGVLFLIIRK